MHIRFSSRVYLMVLATLFVTCAARADGLKLDHGRYVGPVLVLDLSEGQKSVIERYRSCVVHNPNPTIETNEFTPYVLALTIDQKRVIKAKKGFAPRYFEVFETFRGENDAGPFWNVALRFSEDKIEVPLDLLVTERESRLAQKEQGWKSNNPCFPDLMK
jgi:hypothetical protein